MSDVNDAVREAMCRPSDPATWDRAVLEWAMAEGYVAAQGVLDFAADGPATETASR